MPANEGKHVFGGKKKNRCTPEVLSRIRFFTKRWEFTLVRGVSIGYRRLFASNIVVHSSLCIRAFITAIVIIGLIVVVYINLPIPGLGVLEFRFEREGRAQI